MFARRGTFVVFTVPATGMVAATGRRSVVGMLAGARMTQQISFHAALLNSSGAIILFIYTGGSARRPRHYRGPPSYLIAWARTPLTGLVLSPEYLDSEEEVGIVLREAGDLALPELAGWQEVVSTGGSN